MSSSSSERLPEDALLRRVTVSVMLLLPCAVLACGEAGDEAAPLDLEGVWTVVGHHAPGVVGMSEMDAEDWRGQTIRLTPARAVTARAHCDAPGYAPHLVRRDSFLAAEYQLPADALRRAGLPDRVTVLEVSCGGIPWATMGGRLIGIEADRALAPWNGIFFEVVRESDFRAVGQEPGWLLEIRLARGLRLITDYGADTVFAPVRRAETDSATGARTYHASTAGRDLRVLIQPTACSDAMSGEPYETTVTVTLDGRAYHGCGGPLP